MAIAKREIAGLILIGGKSTRMGRPKALVELAGIPLWLRAVESLTPHVNEVLFLGHVPGFIAPPEYRQVYDNPSDVGPLGGLLAGLDISGYEHHLLVAVDYPLVRFSFLEGLGARIGSLLAICGQTSEFVDPLVAYYHKDCAPVIRTMLAEGETRTHRLFGRVSSFVIPPAEMLKIDPAKWCLFNVNTPLDLIEAESRLRSGYPT